MNQVIDIEQYACNFLEALSEEMRYHTAQQTAFGNHSAPQGHFALMTLHNKLTAIPRDGSDWIGYQDNVMATAKAYWRFLKASGNPCAQAVKAIFKEVEALLNQHMPPVAAKTGFRAAFSETSY